MKQQGMEYLKRKVRPSCLPNSVLVGIICFFPQLVLELCRTEQTAGLQSHLDRIHAARSHPGDTDVSLKIFLNPL